MAEEVFLEPWKCDCESGKFIVVQAASEEHARLKVIQEYGETLTTVVKVK